MPVPNPVMPVKGAGTTLWVYKGNGDPYANPLSDVDWSRLAKVKDLTPGELTAESYDDSYLDDEDADWTATGQGQKSAGDTSFTLAWMPGEQGQQALLAWFNEGDTRAYKIRFPNGTVDVFRGWVSSIGKAVTAKEVITRTVKVTNVGRPSMAEDRSTVTAATGMTVTPASTSVVKGQSTTLTVAFQPEGVTWCMQTPPGRYLVEQRTHPDFNPIIPDIGFTGVLEIKISDRVYSQAEHQGKRKLLTFYGQYGDVYRTVLDANPTNPSLRPWDSGYINRSGIASLLGSDSRAPEVGNIILAAYYGTSDSDMTRTLQRGKIYPGSRLGHVEFSGGVATGAGVKGITPTCYVSGLSYSLSLPGAYRALSGSGGVLMADNNTIVGLFVRVR